jgi:hypothetical protein
LEVSIPVELGGVLVRLHPTPAHLATAIVRVFADQMASGALYHVKFVGRLLTILLTMVTNITNILLDPPGDRLNAGDNLMKGKRRHFKTSFEQNLLEDFN